ncbi:MAG: RDD family protein [Acidimicrobiia bacterium]|nr:RDD family protein [Acidimicrobiia bacterium]
MSDYYDLLGIDTGADKESIRVAYRDRLEGASQSERAKLNKAWNVLSDPVQRGRYDAYLASDSEFGDIDDEDAADDVAVPARSARAARPARGGRSEASPSKRQPARPPLEPTIELPRGLEFASKKSRSLAFAMDFGMVLIIMLVSLQIFPQMFDSAYQDNVKVADRAVKQLDKSTKTRDDARDAASTARDRQKAAEKKNDDAEVRKQRAIATKKDAEAKTAEAERKADDTAVTSAFKKLTGPRIAASLVALALSTLLLVPMSARTGQTIGKRSQRIRLIRADGSPAGWVPSLIHYGVPLAMAMVVANYVGPLGTFVMLFALGGVLWNLRDRNRQSVFDKMAKTIVVADSDVV